MFYNTVINIFTSLEYSDCLTRSSKYSKIDVRKLIDVKSADDSLESTRPCVFLKYQNGKQAPEHVHQDSFPDRDRRNEF